MLIPGSIVRCRERDWVLMPSRDQNVHLLRPLAGGDEDIVAIRKELSELIGYSLPEERVVESHFPLPEPDDVSNLESARLLWHAARLNLREAAAPFRSLGRISIRPRVYQFVPLLMAFRLDPVRLFIADDVGVGKTIEALLVARELLDRGEISRLCVLCPPYLCDQWEQELRDKFHIDAVVVRSGTIGQLERRKPASASIYEHFPFTVASIDFIKTERNRHQFLQFCPELVIVDEVHGAAESSDENRLQQERHRLLQDIARDQSRHLILLTATPHSGIERAFCSLLSLLHPDFAEWDIAKLQEKERERLARHFVQRTRADIQKDWLSREGEDSLCFPQRVSEDATYQLSPEYRRLYERTYELCLSIVRSGMGLAEYKRRFRYLSALSLLRSVMSSPASALAAIENRLRPRDGGEETLDILDEVVEASEQTQVDEVGSAEAADAEESAGRTRSSTLRELKRLAEPIRQGDADTKFSCCLEQVRKLLQDGFHPIIWCRYVHTAEYVAERLSEALRDENAEVCCVTGRMPDDERRARIDEIPADSPRVLVATDCLSEGINLQQKFSATLHYDLPWNPNRLEQREGRVDRYGQTSAEVRTIRLYGRDNPVDGVVVEVLLNKAREIHKALGTYVPVPEDRESLAEVLASALFFGKRPRQNAQLQLTDLDVPTQTSLQKFHTVWDEGVERERESRTRFAQRALKPEEVEKELKETDAVLGDPEEVRLFVLAAMQRLDISINPNDRKAPVYRIPLEDLSSVPEPIRLALPEPGKGRKRDGWTVSFQSPTPEGAEFIGRNHPFVQALARYLMEQALAGVKDAAAKRCGAVKTRAVREPTTLLLLRARYRASGAGPSTLWEEIVATGWEQSPSAGKWLEPEAALRLLAEAQPSGNIEDARKAQLLRDVLRHLPGRREGQEEREVNLAVSKELKRVLECRAKELLESHKRIRQELQMKIKGMKVEPLYPPDILGVLILEPEVAR